MRRHLDYYTGSDQPLKDRSRFWTWYMRGLHGDMDTRFEGDRRLPALGIPPPRSTTVLVPEKIPVSVTKPLGRNDGLRFVPLNSNTYGYHPKGVSFGPRPARSIPEPAPVTSALLPLEKPWKDWSTPLKSLDDLLLNPPRSLLPRTTIPRRHWIPPRTLHFDPELDDLLILEQVPRSASSEALEAAEKALAILKSVVGRYKSTYDTSVQLSIENLQNFIDSLRMPTNKHLESEEKEKIEMYEMLERPLRRLPLDDPLWRPRLFLDDDALLPSRSWIREPWWWDFPELRPLDLALPWYRHARHSYLSPIKRTYLWGYHPMRPYGFHKI